MKRKFYQLCNKSFDDLQVKTHKELWDKLKTDGYNGLLLECFTVFQKAEGDDNKFHAIFSTAKEDRHGDIVEQNWDLKSFKKNNVYLDSHNYDSIEHIIGKIDNIGVSDKKKLEGDIVFALSNPKGQLAHDLAAEGFLNTNSVGFIPKVFDDKGRILESELLEVSAVSVPANPEAYFDKKYERNNSKNAKDAADNGEGNTGDGDGSQADGGDDKPADVRNKGNGGAGNVKNKEFENWDDGDTEIRLKVRDIAEFTPGTLKRVTIKKDIPRIDAIIGTLEQSGKEAIQMLFFPKADGWTLDDAKKWFTVRQLESLGVNVNKDKPGSKETNGDQNIEDEDSINSGKDVKSIGKEAKKLLVEALTNVAGKKSDRSKLLNKILLATRALGETNQVDTRSQTDRAKEKRKINQAIRNLFRVREK